MLFDHCRHSVNFRDCRQCSSETEVCGFQGGSSESNGSRCRSAHPSCCQSGRSVPVMVRDVSANGCCVECDETLPIAETVCLDLGDDRVEAEVRWALPGAAGLQLIQQNVERRWPFGRK